MRRQQAAPLRQARQGCSRVQGQLQPTRRAEAAAARRTAHRSARRLLHTLALEALGLGAWLSGSAADALGAGESGTEGAPSPSPSPSDNVHSVQTAVPSGAGIGQVSVGRTFARSADSVRRELSAALAALVSEPYGAAKRGEGLWRVARRAAAAVPGVVTKPSGAAAAAVQRACLDMQQAAQQPSE